MAARMRRSSAARSERLPTTAVCARAQCCRPAREIRFTNQLGISYLFFYLSHFSALAPEYCRNPDALQHALTYQFLLTTIAVPRNSKQALLINATKTDRPSAAEIYLSFALHSRHTLKHLQEIKESSADVSHTDMVKETLLEISTSDHGEFSAHLVGGTWGSGFSAHLVGGMRERFFSTPAGWYEGAESCYSLRDFVITCKLVLCHILCYIHFTQHCLSDTNSSSSIFSLHYLADRFAHAPALCMHLLRRESNRLRLLLTSTWHDCSYFLSAVVAGDKIQRSSSGPAAAAA